MNRDGLYLGITRNIHLDKKTGVISRIFVEPSEYVDPYLYTLDETGNLILPSDLIESIEENIVVKK